MVCPASYARFSFATFSSSTSSMHTQKVQPTLSNIFDFQQTRPYIRQLFLFPVSTPSCMANCRSASTSSFAKHNGDCLLLQSQPIAVLFLSRSVVLTGNLERVCSPHCSSWSTLIFSRALSVYRSFILLPPCRLVALSSVAMAVPALRRMSVACIHRPAHFAF